MKRDILFLHGAIGSKEQFDPIIPLFTDFNCYTLNFSGHGGLSLPEETFTIQLFGINPKSWGIA